MKKLIVLFLLVLSACAPKQQEQITQHMQETLRTYASQYESWYPDAERNIAQICLDAPGLIFEMDGLTALTCALPHEPGRYGIVTFDKSENVLDAFTARADSAGELTVYMQSAGWK